MQLGSQGHPGATGYGNKKALMVRNYLEHFFGQHSLVHWTSLQHRLHNPWKYSPSFGLYLEKSLPFRDALFIILLQMTILPTMEALGILILETSNYNLI